MNTIERRQLKLNTRQLRQLRLNIAIAAVMIVVLIAYAAFIGHYVTWAVKFDMTLTDDVIASIYLVSLVLLYPLISFMLPAKTRR